MSYLLFWLYALEMEGPGHTALFGLFIFPLEMQFPSKL